MLNTSNDLSQWEVNLMWHTLFITAHAATGTIALLTGCLALLRRRWFWAYAVSLAGMELSLLAAVATRWATIDLAARLLFVAFAVLGVVMLVHAELARRHRPAARYAPSPFYIERIGFTLVSLFDAFVVVTVLNTGAAVWAVITCGVTIAVAGHFGIRSAKAHLAATESQDSESSPAMRSTRP